MNTNFYFDKVVGICMNDRPAKQKQLINQLDHYLPGVKFEIFEAISTRHLKNHHIGCALSHRKIIEDAKKQECKNVLVFEEDAMFHKNFSSIFNNCIDELKNIRWDLFYLGACIWKQTFNQYHDCKYLQTLKKSTCTQGIAYNHTTFDHVLDSLPDNIEDMTQWCKKHAAIDQWLMYKIQNSADYTAVISTPRICSQPFLIGTNKQDSTLDFKIT